MIISFESGRLGNQLFQYCGLKKLFKNELILFVGMDAFRSTFNNTELGKRAIFTEKIVQLFGKKILHYVASELHIIGYAKEYDTFRECKYSIKKGLLNKIVYFDTAYFQNENMIDDEIASSIQIKYNLLKNAEDIHKKLPEDRAEIFFVHIRRGDYISWPACQPAILPLRWYHEQMDQIRTIFRKPFFVLVSDDKPYAEKMFGNRTYTMSARRTCC